MRRNQRLLYQFRKGCWRKKYFETKNAACGFISRNAAFRGQRVYRCPYGCQGFHLTTKPKGW